MVVTKELVFPRRKFCYGDFGRDGAGLSTCGHGGYRAVDVVWRLLVEEMLRVTELAVRVSRVATCR
jgi:hypothetical protein